MIHLLAKIHSLLIENYRFPQEVTKNGEGDFVVMNITAFDRREKMLKLREELLSVEEDRIHGEVGYSADEVASMMRNAIREVLNGE